MCRNGCRVHIAIAFTTAPRFTVLSCFVFTRLSTYISGGPSPPSGSLSVESSSQSSSSSSSRSSSSSSSSSSDSCMIPFARSRFRLLLRLRSSLASRSSSSSSWLVSLCRKNMVQSWFRTCAWSGSISSASMCSSPVMATGNWCSMTGPRSMSKDATRMYSTWFSVPLRGYCERNLRRGCAWGLYRGPTSFCESELCCEESPVRAVPVEGVLLLELGSDERSGSDVLWAAGGWGDREFWDMPEPDRDEGKEESDVLRFW